MEKFTTDNSVVILVDHQTTTLSWVKSLPQATVIASCRVMARMALTYAMPLVLTTTMEDYVGPTIDEIREVAPDAFAQHFKRGGQLTCWDDPALRDHVHSLGRSNVILAGLTTDICLFWAAVGALELGYKVMVVADACGTMTEMGDSLTFARLQSLGVTVTVTNQFVTELVNDFGTPEGQKAQQIMSDEIIPGWKTNTVRRDEMKAKRMASALVSGVKSAVTSAAMRTINIGLLVSRMVVSWS